MLVILGLMMHKLFILAGEASGDLLGARLYTALRRQSVTCKAMGMGGDLMRSAGVMSLISLDGLSVVGGFEVIRHIKRIYSAYRIMKAAIKQEKPDLVILIDYPDFNLRIAKIAKQQGAKVFYYVSPQLWAWRYRRIWHMKKYVDHVAVLFSFEERLYQKAGIPVTFVGHPAVDMLQSTVVDTNILRLNARLHPDHPVVGLLPGSRKQEVYRTLPIMLEAIQLIKTAVPKVQFVWLMANTLSKESIGIKIPEEVRIIENNTLECIHFLDAAVAVSGTITLEIALRKVPLLVLYKMSKLSFILAKHLIKTPYIALCNLVAEHQIVTEFIQNQVTPAHIAEEVIRLLTDFSYRQSMIKKMDPLVKQLGSFGASQRAASAVAQLLNQ